MGGQPGCGFLKGNHWGGMVSMGQSISHCLLGTGKTIKGYTANHMLMVVFRIWSAGKKKPKKTKNNKNTQDIIYTPSVLPESPGFRGVKGVGEGTH